MPTCKGGDPRAERAPPPPPPSPPPPSPRLAGANGLAANELIANGRVDTGRADTGLRETGGVLGALIASGRSRSDPALNSFLEELLVAGSATTATAVLSALLALFASDDPELLPRAQAEAELVLSSPRLDFRSSFLCACLHEGMRLNPPAPLLFRVARVDVSLLDTTGVTIVNVRAGSAIVMAAAALASDRDAWDAPGQFRPERWLSTQDVRSSVDGGDGGGGGASRVTSRGVPTEFSFGAGPRGCAGSQLAMSIAPVILAVALREVRSLER
mmetsp:Transcript_19903/g.50741  ORF Transcript_19903/g.50741 Transcript_19903/m.50741 type:complete len:272 (+) Transcript_19903:1131-1946(+)